MQEEYNSILKEKKVYKDQSAENKHPMLARFMLLGIFLSFVVVIISYIVYYNVVLDNEAILLNNMKKISDKYKIIYENLDLGYNFLDNYMLEGDVVVDNISYKYNIIKDNNKFKRTISNGNNSIGYYYDSDLSYMRFSMLGDSYIEMDSSLYSLDEYYDYYDLVKDDFYGYVYNTLLNSNGYDVESIFYNIDNYKFLLSNIKYNFSNSSVDRDYIRKFYFDDGRPVVEVSLIMDTDYLNKILGNGVNNIVIDDDMEVIITMKNDAIMNDIKNIKIVFNNKTLDSRSVLNYDGNDFVYTDNEGVNYKYVLTYDDNDFELKYYKDDVLYSVLTGKVNNDEYDYSYQVIDKKYNISLIIVKGENEYSYSLSSNIDDKSSSILINGVYNQNGIILEDVSSVVSMNNLSDIQKNTINNSIKSLLFG